MKKKLVVNNFRTVKVNKDCNQVKNMGMCIMAWCMKHSFEFQKEYKFCSYRRFRFDFCVVNKKIAIEYEGIFSRKSGHTTIKGYMKDIEKYNLATMLGFRILRYHAGNYLECLNDLEKLISIEDPKPAPPSGS